MPSVSVIIPSLNSPSLAALLQALLEQDYRDQYSITVVGQDKQGFFANFSGQAKLIETPKPVNAAVARNIGIQDSDADIYLFIDSDCLPEKNWISAMVNKVAQGWQVIGGGVSVDGNAYLPLIYNLSMLHEFLSTQAEREVNYLPTLNLAVIRSVIEKVGLLDERLARSQDLDWTMRMVNAGFKVLFYPDALVSHQPDIPNFGQIWKQFYRSGFYSSQIRRKNRAIPSFFLLRLPMFWYLFSPLIALGITVRNLLQTKAAWKYLYAMPGVYLSKIAWCIGAGDGSKKGNQQHAGI